MHTVFSDPCKVDFWVSLHQLTELLWGTKSDPVGVDLCEEDGCHIGRDDGEMDNSAANLRLNYYRTSDDTMIQKNGPHVLSRRQRLSKSTRASVSGWSQLAHWKLTTPHRFVDCDGTVDGEKNAHRRPFSGVRCAIAGSMVPGWEIVQRRR